MPFRGLHSFSYGDFEYTFEITGDCTFSTGDERIFYKDIEVFYQHVMGQLIK